MSELQRKWLSVYWSNKPNLVLVIPNTPPSVNNYLVHTARATYKSATARRFQALVQDIFTQVAPHWLATERPVGIVVDFRIGANTTMDIDNHMKVINDALNGLAWIDDSQIESMLVTKTAVQLAKGQLVRDVKQTTVRIYVG